MSIVSIIAFLICFGILFFSLIKKTDILSPGRTFAFVWTIIIGVTSLKLSRYQEEWSVEIWLHILIGPVAFLAGTLIIYIININKEVFTLEYFRSNKQLYEINTERLFFITIALFVLFIISYFFIFLKAGAIPLFAEKPWEVRRDFTMFGIGLFLHNVFLIALLASIYIIFQKGRFTNKALLFLLTFISVLLYSATLQRYQIILSIFIIFLLLYYTSFKINYKSVIIAAMLLIGFFYAISSFRLGELVLFIMYKISKMKFSPEYAVFTEPYMYIAMNLENYAYSIKKLHDFSYGFYTFDFLTAITGLKHWIVEYFHLVENPFLISINYNTYSAFWTYYRDFGVLGIFIIPFLGGVGISSLFYSFKENPTIPKLSFYGMFLYVTIFSFFNSAFGFLWFVYNVIALIIIFKLVSSPKEISSIQSKI